MTVEHVSEGRGAHPVQKGYLDAKRKLDQVKSEGKGQPPPSADHVEISQDAQRLKQRDALIQELRSSMERMPEIRDDLIRAAEERIATNHYGRKEVLERLADALMEGAGGPDTLGTRASGDSFEPSDIRLDKIEIVQQRITQGYYDTEDVLETLVQILMG